MSTGEIYLLGAVAGFTIFLGLPVGRARTRQCVVPVDAREPLLPVLLVDQACRVRLVGGEQYVDQPGHRQVVAGVELQAGDIVWDKPTAWTPCY